MNLIFEKININELVVEIVQLFNELSKRKNNILTVTNKTFSTYIIGDELKIKQILMNLLSNANKFTENGKIELEISEEALNKNYNQILFKVIDTGIGIHEDKLNKLFEMFEQGEHHLTKKYGGTGIGLSIVKKLVDLMNGKVYAESKLGVGTTFYVEIPVLSHEQKMVLEKSEELTNKIETNLSKYYVLIAEDNEMNSKLLQRMIADTNIRYDIVYDGEDALKKIQVNRYDLILMDSQMPIINGLDVIKSIRENEVKNGLPKLPIISVSAYALKEDVDKAFAVGSSDYLAKPFSKRKLLDIIQKWLIK